MMKTTFFSFLAILSFLIFSCNKEDESGPVSEIIIPADSVDALAAAIDEIAPNGVIILAAGEHCESGTILIEKTIKLIGVDVPAGEDGAILIVDTGPIYTYGETLDPAIYVFQAPGTRIENIELRPKGEIGGTGVIFEESEGAILRGCTFTKHQYNVVSQNSDNVDIDDNYMECTDAWLPYLAAEIPEAIGITIVNGVNVHIHNNVIKGGLIGAWVTDDGGTVDNNTITKSYIGVIPCAVTPETQLTLPKSSKIITSNMPGTKWTIKDNSIHENLWFGILLFDGSIECHVENNDCTGNGLSEDVPYVDDDGEFMFFGTGADIEAGGESMVFGFPTVATKDNTIIVGADNPGVRVKICGTNNSLDTSGGAGIVLDRVSSEKEVLDFSESDQVSDKKDGSYPAF